MKKAFCAALLGVLMASLATAQTNGSLRLDSIRTFSYSVTGDSTLNTLTTYEYPQSGTSVITSFVRQTGTGRMLPNSRTTREMDALERMRLLELEVYSQTLGRFATSSRTLFYQSPTFAKRTDSIVRFQGNTTTGIVTKLALQYDFKYDANDNNTLYRLFDYTTPNASVRHQLIDNQYNSDNRIAQITNFIGASVQALTPYTRATYTYSGDTIRLSSASYDTVSRRWLPDLTSTPRMDIITSTRRTIIFYRWAAANQRWEQVSLQITDYDQLGRIAETYLQTSATQAQRNVYSYRGNEKEIRNIRVSQLNPATGATTSVSRTYYFYGQSVPVRPSLAEKIPLTVSPNPATQHMMIDAGNQTIRRAVLSDWQGRLVYANPAINHTSFRLERGQMPAGLYVLQLQLDNHSLLSRKVVWAE